MHSLQFSILQDVAMCHVDMGWVANKLAHVNQFLGGPHCVGLNPEKVDEGCVKLCWYR